MTSYRNYFLLRRFSVDGPVTQQIETLHNEHRFRRIIHLHPQLLTSASIVEIMFITGQLHVVNDNLLLSLVYLNWQYGDSKLGILTFFVFAFRNTLAVCLHVL
jgi:hypothetical protein